jgi:hypothetical protein
MFTSEAIQDRQVLPVRDPCPWFGLNDACRAWRSTWPCVRVLREPETLTRQGPSGKSLPLSRPASASSVPGRRPLDGAYEPKRAWMIDPSELRSQITPDLPALSTASWAYMPSVVNLIGLPKVPLVAVTCRP